MYYQEGPQPGDFEVVPIGGPGGRLIHLGEVLNGSGFGDYEHARLYLGDRTCVQAEPGGATIVPIDFNDHGLWSTAHFSGVLTEFQRASIVQAGRLCGPHNGQPGVGYSSTDYLALGAQRLHLGLVVPFLDRYVASSGHMICSQLVDWCYLQAGVHLFDDKRKPGHVTPEDLAVLIDPSARFRIKAG